MKDYNRIARIEQAIAKKYGSKTVEDPRSNWDDAKEGDYQEQLKKLATREANFEERTEKEEVNGILMSKKLLTRETTRRSCPVCKVYSFSLKDDAYMNRYDCCFNCYVHWVEGREERWETGWRPTRGDK